MQLFTHNEPLKLVEYYFCTYIHKPVIGESEEHYLQVTR